MQRQQSVRHQIACVGGQGEEGGVDNGTKELGGRGVEWGRRGEGKRLMYIHSSASLGTVCGAKIVNRWFLTPVCKYVLVKRLCLCLKAEAGEPVAIYGEGKEHAMAIGITKMSTKEMREINKGHGVDVVHYLNDGLWKTQQFA